MNIMNEETRQEYLKRAKEYQKGLGVGMRNKGKKFVRLSRHGMISDEFSRRIYPLDFTLPFNPWDLSDDTYDAEFRFIFPGSATSGFLALKAMMKESPELTAKVAKMAGVAADTFDVDSQEVTTEEFKAIQRWRMPKSFSELCFATQFSDRKNPIFPTLFRADCTLDEDGNVDEKQEYGVFWDLYKIESECLSRKAAAIRESYESGDNSHRSSKDRGEELKKLWNGRLISRPYWKYAVRYLHIVCDSQTFEPEKAAMEAWKDGKIVDLDCIKLTGMTFLESLNSRVGTPRDVHMDYIEMEYQNPTIPKSDEHKKGAYANQVTKAQVSPSESVTNPTGGVATGRKILTDFDTIYREYLDDPKMWDFSVIRANVREFGTISDEALISRFQTDLSAYADVMSSAAISQAFENSRIETSKVLTDELMRKALAGETKTEVLPKDRVDQQDIKKLQEEEEAVADTSTRPAETDDNDDFMSVLSGLAEI